jgi:hypothetical protein
MRWRSWAAWWVSALAHALLAGLLLRARTPETSSRISPAPIEIEIAEVPRPGSDQAPVARSADRSAHSRRELIRTRSEPASRGDAPPRTDVQPARTPGASSPDRPAVSAPELSFRTLSPDIQARIAVPSADAALAVRAPGGKLSVDELRVAHEREEDAAANVAAGRVDPLLYDYLRGARVRFQDEAQRIAEAIPIGAGETVRGWGRGLVARVREAHRNDRTADDVQPDLRDDATKRRPDLAAAYDENRRQAEAGAEIRRVEVCLDVAPGRDTTATLRRGSGNAALDRVALDAFARAVSVRPVPRDARPGRACYEVRTATYRAGPALGIACDLNLGPHGPTCIWPLKKMTSVTSQLLGVEYPAKKSSPANDSLLRGAR